jgi:STE24 endopeptidase
VSNNRTTNLPHRTLLAGLLVLAVACFFGGIPPEVQAAEEIRGAAQTATESATEARSRVVPVPEASAKTLRYYRSGNVLWVVTTLWGLFVPALILFTGFSARLRDWASAIGRKWFFVIGVYVVLYLAVLYALNFPLSYYSGFVHQHAYGLSNQNFAHWFVDSLKALVVAMVMGALFLWIPYLLLKKSPRRWWLYTSLVSVPLLALVMLVQPVVIAPLFDDFGPMQDKALEAEILELANRAGIDGGRVFEVNKSEDTKTLNAYVGGLLETKRIVLWDTLLRKLDREQVLVVMGHEMGHFVLDHVWYLFALLSVLILASLYVAHRALGFLIPRFQHRFGFSEVSDVASLPLLSLLISVFFLIVQPIAFAYSRHIEREADRFGLEITRNNYAMASALTLLHEENLAHPNPGPLYQLWRSRHPPIAERIEIANRYRPWETGQPLKYADYFRSP